MKKSIINLLTIAVLFNCCDAQQTKKKVDTDSTLVQNNIELNTMEQNIYLNGIKINKSLISESKENKRFINRKFEFDLEINEKIDLNLNDTIDQVTFYNGSVWKNDPGDFRRVRLELDNSDSLEIDNMSAWIKTPERLKEYSKNGYFIQLDIGFDKPVLIFIGYPYASDPEYLTIVSVDSGRPGIVFNYGFDISRIEKQAGKDIYKIIGKRYSDEEYEILVEDNELKYRKVET